MKNKSKKKTEKKHNLIIQILHKLSHDLNFLIHRITKWKKILKFRSKIFWILTIISYIFLILQLFYFKDILSSVPYLLLFFVAFHYFFIEIYKEKQKNMLYVLLILSVIQIVFFWIENLYITLAILTLNIWIFLLSDYLKHTATSRRKFYSRSYFVSWWYSFTIFLTVTYCLTLLGTYKQFPFTCQDLSNNSEKFVNVISQPFKLWIQEASNLKNSIENFITHNKLIDIISFWSNIEVQEKSTWTIYSWILWKINWYKQIMFDQVMEDNELVNMGTCDFLLWEIKKRYDKPTFKFSVILLSFLLLYPFLRLTTYIVSVISYLLYHVLKIFNIYRKRKIEIQVEEIV